MSDVSSLLLPFRDRGASYGPSAGAVIGSLTDIFEISEKCVWGEKERERERDIEREREKERQIEREINK